MSVHNIAVVMTGNATSLRSALLTAGRDVGAFTKQVDAVGTTGSRVGSILQTGLKAGVLAVGVAMAYGVAKASELDTALRNVQSITKESDEQLKRTSATLVGMSTRLPQSAKTLAEGLYNIASSGFQGAEGLMVLEAAATAASAGLTTTEISAKAITAVLNAYGLSASDAADVSDVLFQTVNVGVVSFEELASELGDVVGLAAVLTVDIDEVGSAIATMTLSGISAAESATALNRTMQALSDPSAELQEALKGIGYESGVAALQEDSLATVMEKLRVASGGNIETLQKWFPEIRALKGALALTANEGLNYAKVVGFIESEEARQGATRAALNEQLKAVSAQWTLFKNKVDAAAITLGNQLLPVVLDTLRILTDLGRMGVTYVADAFRRLDPFLTAVVAVFKDLVTVAGVLADTFGPIVGGVAALLALGVITFLNAFGTAVSALTGFLAENETAVKVLATVLAGVYLSSITAAVGATAALAAEWAALKIYAMAGLLDKAMAALSARAVAMRAGFGGLWASMQTGVGVTSGLRGALNSLGPALAISGAIFAVTKAFEAYGDEARKATEHGKTWASEFAGTFDASKATAAELEAEIARLSGAADEMQRHADNALNPFLDDRLKTARDELRATAEPLVELQEVAGRLEEALGITADEALALASDQDFMAGATNNATGELDEEAAAALHALESLSALADQLKAMYDPLFGLQDSMNGLKDAQQAVTDAIAANSDANADNNVSQEELIRLNQAAVKAAVDYQGALVGLKEAISTGDVQLETAISTLYAWADAGLITQEQARQSEVEIRALGAAADATDGKDILVTAHANTDEAKARLEAFRRMIETTPKTVTVTFNGVTGTRPNVDYRAGRQRWGGIHAYARGGVTPAHITKDELIKYGEPETGGEAFIPRRGDRRRSEGILDVAAGWYGMRVVPMAAGGYIGMGQSAIAARTSFAANLRGTEMGRVALWAAGGDAAATMAALEQVADKYYEVVAALNEADARSILMTSRSIEDFNRLADAAIRARQAQEKREDVMFQVGDMSLDEYIAALRMRLAVTEKYSDDYGRLWSQINSLTEQKAAEQEAILRAHNDRLAQLTSELTSVYTSAQGKYMAQQEAYANAVQQVQSRIAEETRAFRDDIVQSYRQLSDPVALFGGEQNVTATGIERALRHRLDAASKFAATYKQLVARGLNKEVLTSLAQGGPENLSLAQALLKVDPALVNEAMSGMTKVGNEVSGIALQWEQSRIASEAYASVTFPVMKTMEQLLNEELVLWKQKHELEEQAMAWAQTMTNSVLPGLIGSYSQLGAELWSINQAMMAIASQGGLVSAGGGMGVPVASFDSGGYLRPGFTMAYNGTGAPERVGGPLVSVGSGAVQISVSGGGNVDTAQMQRMIDQGFQRLARSIERKVRR